MVSRMASTAGLPVECPTVREIDAGEHRADIFGVVHVGRPCIPSLGGNPTRYQFPLSIGGGVDLPSYSRFELARPVARHGQVRIFAIFQTNVQRSAGERCDFLNPLHVDHCASVDAEEFLWVEFLF